MEQTHQMLLSLLLCEPLPGQKSQDTWVRNKESVPSRSLGIMVNYQSLRMGLREEIFAESEENVDGKLLCVVGPALGPSLGPDTGPMAMASSPLWTLRQAERYCHPCWPTC